jgi:hypothetical protein
MPLANDGKVRSAPPGRVGPPEAAAVRRGAEGRTRLRPWNGEHASADSGETRPLRVEQPELFAWCQAAAGGIAMSGERAGQPLLRLVAGGYAEAERENDRAATTDPVADALGVTASRSGLNSTVEMTVGPWAPPAGTSAVPRRCAGEPRPVVVPNRSAGRPGGCVGFQESAALGLIRWHDPVSGASRCLLVTLSCSQRSW